MARSLNFRPEEWVVMGLYTPADDRNYRPNIVLKDTSIWTNNISNPKYKKNNENIDFLCRLLDFMWMGIVLYATISFLYVPISFVARSLNFKPEEWVIINIYTPAYDRHNRPNIVLKDTSIWTNNVSNPKYTKNNEIIDLHWTLLDFMWMGIVVYATISFLYVPISLVARSLNFRPEEWVIIGLYKPADDMNNLPNIVIIDTSI